MTASRTGAPPPASNPRFSQPVRQVLLMLTVLVLVLAGGWIAYGRILPIFMANRWLNGLILTVFALGVLACFWQLGQLVRSVSWIERFAERRRNAVEKGLAARGADDSDVPPRLLAPLAALLGTRGPAGGVISTGSARSILESVATRIDELRDITRYLSNLLIFLGLLGTFYGLATTVPAVVETIRALAPQEGESGIEVFDKLMGGLEAQLGGMATAFSSSLLGLAGSLVVGLLELFVTHGQNRFHRELEEWMSGFTRVSLATSEGEGLDQAAISGFLEQMAAQMDRLQQFHAERDSARDDAAIMADERIVVMAEAVEALAERAGAEREASLARTATLVESLSRMADGQDRMLELARLRADQPQTAPSDLSGIEAALNRLAADLSEGRDEMVAELRSDLLVLTRAVRAARFGDPFPDDLRQDPLMTRGKG
ncbi:biopolymer transporter ExbB [Paracoccus sp. XHP0099]|uniref:Biopolymer transporter ExbB n=1 Tax=Paracoccus marinaquae TaxID=2841926 RepID=A0ABS6AF56_9RHOB|nr:biopolymer transporter ExbB [Paracoccus marinaquae]